MRMTQEIKDATIGEVAAFIQRALASGVALSAPIEFQKSRGNKVVSVGVELMLPGMEKGATSADVAAQLATQLASAKA